METKNSLDGSVLVIIPPKIYLPLRRAFIRRRCLGPWALRFKPRLYGRMDFLVRFLFFFGISMLFRFIPAPYLEARLAPEGGGDLSRAYNQTIVHSNILCAYRTHLANSFVCDLGQFSAGREGTPQGVPVGTSRISRQEHCRKLTRSPRVAAGFDPSVVAWHKSKLKLLPCTPRLAGYQNQLATQKKDISKMGSPYLQCGTTARERNTATSQKVDN